MLDPKTGKDTIHHEPFTAGFTGQLKTWVSASGRRYIFNAPLPRIEKGRAYMMEFNMTTNSVRLIAIVPAIQPKVRKEEGVEA